ncbi:hypothetical protein M5K25_018464 [Dendrobium thyrsiflorum]|uniref:Uncharacterized protein n=1 Tax=Dendrobium thyrsiflorum TaxID=117978 RepID=A0ABD0UQ91_DENTH
MHTDQMKPGILSPQQKKKKKKKTMRVMALKREKLFSSDTGRKLGFGFAAFLLHFCKMAANIHPKINIYCPFAEYLYKEVKVQQKSSKRAAKGQQKSSC